MSSNISFIAKIEEVILKHTKPKYMDSEEKIDEYLKSKPEAKLPRGIFKMSQSNLYTFGNKNADKTVLYMHGGAYVNEMNYQHLLYCYLLSRKLNVHVIAPVYPLGPVHKACETFEIITELYKSLNHENLILMGDSAGGGFVLSFAQYLKTIGLCQPSKIIAFSPWIDISMSKGPYDSDNDPILGEIGLKKIGRAWAGDWDSKDFRVSPLFGDCNNIAPTVIFAGTNEIFFRDIEKFVSKLKNSDVDVKFIKGEGLFHIYPLFPSLEARDAFKKVKKEIIG